MKWQTRTIASRRDWDEGLFSLTLSGAPPAFEAGQFLNLGLELDGERVHRSYSMASPPGAALEFYVVEVEGGRLTPALARLQPGDALDVAEQPAGHFTLAKVPAARVLWCLATGTGLGPFLSILRTPEPWRRFARVVVVHGVRRAAQLAYRDELAAAAAAHEGALTWIPAVSGDAPPPAGLRGRLTTLLEDGSLEAQAGVTIEPGVETGQVMLCGNPGMLRDAGELLKARGLAKNRRRAPGQLTTEAYWQLPRR